MKTLFFLLFPLTLFSQDITGLWVGSLYNDTTQQTIPYHIAIGETNGKYMGYSLTSFTVDNKQVTGIKSLKIVKQDDHFFLEDNELLYNNYPVAPPKGIKQISSVTPGETSNGRSLNGKFITTKFKQYGRQVTGTVSLRQKKEIKDDDLIAMLRQLGLAGTLSFLPKDTGITARKKPVINPKPVKEKKPEAIAVAKKPVNPLEELNKRKIQTIETVWYSSDSLRLVLYDNGYVDGDSVSIILNGKILLEHQRLSQEPIAKTIAAGKDSIQLIMYAENLGSIAPNTGLLIIYDGEKRHEIRFEGDLEKNAAVLLKRR